MATATATPKKTTKASKKTPSHETHGALPPLPQVNLDKMFNISDGYDVDSLEDYSVKLEAYTTPELHEHAHKVGIIPLDQKDKLVAALRRKFQETKAQRAHGTKIRRVGMNPALADFHKKFMAGDL